MNQKALFSYSGNKDREIAEIIRVMPPLDNIDVFVEPYGGSFSVTRHLYANHGHIEFIVNDIDKGIINIYNTMKDKDTNQKTIDEMKELINTVTPEDYAKMRRIDDMNDVTGLLFVRLFGGKYGQFPMYKKDLHYDKVKNFTDYNPIKFTYGDGCSVIEQYKDNENAFLFIDPPYVATSNALYCKGVDYPLFELLKGHKTWKCKFLMTIDDNVLTRTFAEHYGLNIMKTVQILYRYTQIKGKHVYLSNY